MKGNYKMTVFWFNLGIVYLFSTLSRYFAKPALSEVIKPRLFLAILALTSLVLVAGLQNYIGDTYYYMHSYNIHEFTWEDIKSGKDIGFNLYQMVLQQISNDPQILIFVTALITNILIVITFLKYSRMLEVSLYVYITSGLFLVSMNGIRQFLAAAIVFAATKYIIDGSWKKYVLVVLLAATIHQSALVLIPIYFMVRRKAWTRTTIIMLISSILLVIGYNEFSTILFNAIENTQYGHYKDFSEGGASYMRVVVYAIPVILAFMGREKLREICPYSDYIVNLSILTFIFMIISTQNWIFARFTIYLGLYNIILISWVCKLFAEKDQKLVYYGILIGYLIFFYYEHVISLGMIYRSSYLPW